MSLKERNRIAPQMEDYDRVGDVWVPYLMRFDSPNRTFPSVSTDEHGFRHTVAKSGEGVLSFAEFAGKHRGIEKGIVLGGSTAWGVGATHNRFTIPSFLNRKTSAEWFNFGVRTYSSTQEMILFSLFLPPRIDKLVLFSGVNNLILAYLSSKTSPVYNSFFNQSAFERDMEAAMPRIGVRRAWRRLKKEIGYKLFSETEEIPCQDIGLKYENILASFKRDLAVLHGLSKAYGFDLYFAFQPLATWIDKELTTEEAAIFSILDRMNMDWKILAQYIASQRDRYISDVREACDGFGIPFCDLNGSERFREKKWLFVDRVHLTDHGYAAAVDVMKGAFGL